LTIIKTMTVIISQRRCNSGLEKSMPDEIYSWVEGDLARAEMCRTFIGKIQDVDQSEKPPALTWHHACKGRPLR
jgi:hypothetical protein